MSDREYVVLGKYVVPAETGECLFRGEVGVRGIKVTVYESPVEPGTVSVQIETDEAPGQRIRVMLNDADLFVGDPEVDDHPYSRQVQAYYDNQSEEDS